MELGSLAAEIRRTIAAARNQLHGQSVEHVIVIGNSPAHQTIAEQLNLEAGMTASCFDPTSGVKIRSELEKSLPERIERFSSLFGLLGQDEVAFETINFLDPKQKPKPKSQKQRLLFYSGIAAFVLLGMSYITWSVISSMEAEVADLQKQLTDSKPKMDQLKSDEVKFDSVDKWIKQDAIWLDELLYLSENYSNAESGMVLHLKMSSSQSANPTIALTGVTNGDKISLGDLEQKLRDFQHSVNNSGQSEDDSTKKYDTRFNATITIDHEAVEPKAEPDLKETKTNNPATSVKK